MRRRDFIKAIAGTVAAWSGESRAQEPSRTYRIGFLIRAPRNTPFADAAFDELRVNGFIDEILGDYFEKFGDAPSAIDGAIKAGRTVTTIRYEDHREHVDEWVWAMV